jgi:uncharacterized alpha-E superfamily protein
MLLSRVADSLYWISRYLERAEHTARLVDVAVDHGLGRASSFEGSAIECLYHSVGLDAALHDVPSMAGVALLDLSNRSSVAACITAARENARQVREEISSAMWLQLNELFLRVKQLREEGPCDTHRVSQAVIDGVRLFHGIADGTMGHGEGWQYLQLGRFIERSGATASVLALFIPGDADSTTGFEPRDQVEWVALLQSCSALEAYCRCYTADVRAERVMEFLLLNPEFPRSVRFAAVQLEASLRALAGVSARGATGRVERLAGRLRASLEYAQVDEFLGDAPHAYLSGISRQCNAIHSALYQSYISYPIESGLPAQA